MYTFYRLNKILINIKKKKVKYKCDKNKKIYDY